MNGDCSEFKAGENHDIGSATAIGTAKTSGKRRETMPHFA